MPRFAANLSMMFDDLPFLDRFEAAAQAGFRACEFLFPYDQPADEIARRLKSAGLTQALFNLAPGDWAKGERGLAALPGREGEFAAALDQALRYAGALGCERLHVMSGVPGPQQAREVCEATLVGNLRMAAPRAAACGVTLLLEPINTRDVPGYFLNYQAQACRIIDAVGADNLRLQLDIYHLQIMEGDLSTRIREFLPRAGHVQIANPPGRHEPDHGEIDYRWIFALLDELGWPGWVGCEYRPRAGTLDGLGWFEPYRGR